MNFWRKKNFCPNVCLFMHTLPDAEIQLCLIKISLLSLPSFHRWVINVKFVATPGRSFDGGTFPRQIGLRAVQSVQSAPMERQRRRWRRNLESLITDPPSKYQTLIALHSGTSLHLIGFPVLFQCVVAAVASSVNWRQSREGGGEALGQQLRLHQHSATALCSPLLC